MRYLLDTCTALWYFQGSERIRASLREELQDLSNDLLISDISILEIELKYESGKLPLPIAPSEMIPSLVEKHGFDSIPLSPGVIFELENLPRHHKDPFDRLLVATARVHSLTIVTPDEAVAKYDVSLKW